MNRVLIIGGDSDFNLGDAAILFSLCDCLAGKKRGLELTVTSKRPQRSKTPGVTRVVRRGPKGMGSLLRAAHDSDLVILGGGGLFQDDDSRIKMPYWAGTLSALRLANRNLVGHSLGAGPLRHAESRLAARMACAAMKSVSVRDQHAYRWLAPCTSKNVAVVPDPAFMLRPAPPADAHALLRSVGLSGDRPIVGVAVRRWFHRLGGFVPHRIKAAVGLDKGHGEAELSAFLDQLSDALRRLCRRLDASLLLLPTYNVAHENDAGVCRSLAARLGDVSTGILELNDPQLYKAVAGKLTLMIAARMHPLILASGMGTPIVGLAYNVKFDGLFESLRLPYKPLWLDELKGASFADHLESLAFEALKWREPMLARADALAQSVKQRTEALLETIP